jgi:fatty-acyl-CoA synthase
MKENGLRLTTLKRTVIGGAACPPAMIRTLEDDFGVEVNHAWGMTEMSPLGSVCKLKESHAALPAAQQRKLRETQGRVVFGVDWKIVDGAGAELPRDGKAFGDLLVRGPWVVSGYYKGTQSPLVDGWFPTGDVATLDAEGYLRITDRSKDVVKSGGEWISSIALENLAMAHPAVKEAAVIACRHPKWDERPLLIVVRKPQQELTRDALLRFFEGKVAKWWIPDDVVFVDELPHTATGKLMKTALRERYADHPLPTSTPGTPALSP